MPQYEFECRKCKKVFTLLLRISERATAKIQCPGCGSEDVEAVMQTFVARTARNASRAMRAVSSSSSRKSARRASTSRSATRAAACRPAPNHGRFRTSIPLHPSDSSIGIRT